MSIDYYAKKAVRFDDDILVCAADVETKSLGGELLSVQWGYLGQVKISTSETMVEEFFEDFLSMAKPAIWYLHFAQYDWRYFLDYLEKANLIVEIGLRTETDIYEIRCKREEKDPWCVMRDSYALWSHPLEKLAKSFCPELPKLEIDIENFDPSNPDHIAYAKRDVEILLVALPRLFDMISDHFGVIPSATAAGTALKAWQKSLPKDKIYDASKWNEKEQFIRQGYYGGLVFLTTNRPQQDCITIDRNSSYPAAMMEQGVPVGSPHYTTDFEEHYPGFYRVRIKAPDGLIVPIIPARNQRGNMRWYRGEFETVISSQELQFATKHGYEVLDLYEGFFFESVEFPFTDFIDLCRIIRKAFPDATEEQVAKLLQNSLYGKFGSRRERTRLLHFSQMNDDEMIGAIPFDEEGKWYVKKELDEEMRCLPQWASFITANARLALLEQVYKIGPQNVIYGDTDSITVKRGFEHLMDIGSNYGQWKLEKEWEIFRAIAPKVYSGILAKDIMSGGKIKYAKGSFLGAAKGLPRKGIEERQWRELLENGQTSAQTKSLASLKIAMKKGIKQAETLTRKSSTLNNSMNFDADENGNVRVKYAT